MVRQFLVTLTPAQVAFPAAPQVELPPGVVIDSWTISNNGGVPVALAFGQVRRDAAGNTVDDLTVDPKGVGPTSAFAIDAEDRKIWLRCAAVPGADITVQLNAVLTTRNGSSQPSGGGGNGAAAGLATHAAQVDGTQKTQIVQGGNTAQVTGAGALKVDTGAAGPLALEATQLLVKGQQTDGTQRTKITDGTNNAAVLNSAPVGTEYGLLVRQVGTTPALATITTTTKAYHTGIDAMTSVTLLVANSSAKGRVFYNAGSVVVYISYGSGAHTGQATATFELAAGATYVMQIRSDGSVEWPGEVRAIVGGLTNGSITTTEMT